MSCGARQVYGFCLMVSGSGCTCDGALHLFAEPAHAALAAPTGVSFTLRGGNPPAARQSGRKGLCYSVPVGTDFVGGSVFVLNPFVFDSRL
jgi:hypothetical protein